eukprot:1911047-Prorocentrum_lima.AAC.1
MSSCYSTLQVDTKNHLQTLCEVSLQNRSGYIVYQCSNVKFAETFEEFEQMTIEMIQQREPARR